MFLIRNVEVGDYSDLLGLAERLNTVNLPNNSRDIHRMIRRSTQSFSGQIDRTAGRAQYLMVMEDLNSHRVIGTSKIHARHGTPEKPHIYFKVAYETMASKTLQVAFKRKVYRLRYDTRGYSEIGGLVIKPRFRKHPFHLGRQLSFIRFMLMKAHPSWFRRRVIAELLPPLPGGRSRFWEYYGYRLTRIPYHKADRMSYHNKEFILKLFPKTDLYYDLLPPEVQADIEQTGPGSSAAKHSLIRIGFRYAQQMDPFDGGPYYVAARNCISVVQQTRSVLYGGHLDNTTASLKLVMCEKPGGIRALLSPAQIRRGRLYLPVAAAVTLEPVVGQRFYTYNW